MILLDCGAFPTIDHGSVTGDTVYGGTATVNCDTGYDLSGTLTCGLDGAWGTSPTCDPKGLYVKHGVFHISYAD